MPNFEEHCESTARKLGCRFERIHKWMDSPSQFMGKAHRLRRHDPYKTPETAKEIFTKFYPNHAHLIEEAVLDHIELDKKGGDFTYSATQKLLDDMENEDFYEKIRKEERLKTLKFTPKLFALFVGSSLATYISDLLDSTNTSPLIAIFALIACASLFFTLCNIGEGLGFEPFSFGVFSFIEIGAIIFPLLFGVNNFTLIVFVSFTSFYLFFIIMKWYSDREIKSSRATLRAIYQTRRKMEIGKPVQEDFLSEENLEAHGISSSAVMDIEDEED